MDEAREEGFYWVILGQNPPEIAYWERGEWWLAGDARPWQPDAVTVIGGRLVFRPKLAPVARPHARATAGGWRPPLRVAGLSEQVEREKNN